MITRTSLTYYHVIFFVGCSLQVFTQLPQNPIGSNPDSLKWRQIKTDKVKVIFPSGLDSAAQRVANIVHYLWEREEKSIGSKNIRIPIILHGLRVNPNGFVIVGPFRSEFYNIPSQFKDLSPWVDNLAIHEYRHVQQFANSDAGLSGLTKDIFGSWLWGGLFAAALPRWYYEGDAVIAETGLTSGGRGRFPEFNMGYHSLIQAGIEYDYEKAGAGSLNVYVPNWYELGYNMLSYGRLQYGDTIWQEVADDAIRFKGLLYPFAGSMKKHIGLKPKELYHETMAHLTDEWSQQKNDNKEDQSTFLNRTEKSTVIHYNAPIPLEDENVIALKSGYDRLYELVLLHPDGTEEKLTETGILTERQMTKLSHSNGKIIWAELGFSYRWRNENFSDIFSYDIATKKKKRITKKSRYLSPDLSPDGKWIATVRINQDLSQSLVILDEQSGKLIKELYASIGSELSYPCWINDNHVAFIENKNQQNQILSIDTNTLSIRTIYEKSSQHLSHLFSDSGFLYVSMASDYSNDIYRVDMEDTGVEKLSSSLIGAFQPAIKDDRMYYSEFSHQGYNIKETILRDPSPARSAAEPFTNKPPFYNITVLAEGGNILDKIPNEAFPTFKFNRLSGLINFHSIIPEWQPPEFSVSLLSDNTFSTLSASIEGRYNLNEHTFRYGAGLRYAELYPIISASYFKSNREAIFYNFSPQTDSSFVQEVALDRWDENRATLGIIMPYNFSAGNYNRQFSFSTAYQNTSIRLEDRNDDSVVQRDTAVVGAGNLNQFTSIFKDPISDQAIHTLDVGISFSITKFVARQHLRPTIGLSFLARYRANVGNNDLGGNSFLARGLLYLPGFSTNHSLSIDAIVVNEDILSQYRYSDLFIYPRGYDFSLRRDRFMKVGVNYRFPIAYPDWAIGGHAFIKRLKGNIFFDFGRYGVTRFPFNEQYSNASSAGFELGIDFRAFRLLEIDLGMRYSYLMNEDFIDGSRHQFEFFVVSISE